MNNKESEERIQYQIVEYYRNNYCLNFHNPKHLIFSVPNDGKDLAEQMRKKSTGMLAGVSDIIIVQPGRVLFVEVKTEKGAQQENQKQFESDIKSLGFEYFLVRSFDEFKTKIKAL